ncbi:serine/arginine repetitive matrix protein 1-like [Eschrichtius robustus]|uniref:serine/arginine repetitive matrix protein 1-like n=1 Tax=Eschrichtius robustus TaxID=9764 RepID=UPI0035BFCBB5
MEGGQGQRLLAALKAGPAGPLSSVHPQADSSLRVPFFVSRRTIRCQAGCSPGMSTSGAEKGRAGTQEPEGRGRAHGTQSDTCGCSETEFQALQPGDPGAKGGDEAVLAACVRARRAAARWKGPLLRGSPALQVSELLPALSGQVRRRPGLPATLRKASKGRGEKGLTTVLGELEAASHVWLRVLSPQKGRSEDYEPHWTPQKGSQVTGGCSGPPSRGCGPRDPGHRPETLMVVRTGAGAGIQRGGGQLKGPGRAAPRSSESTEDDRLGLPGKVITCGEGAEPGEESGPCFLRSLILPEPRRRRRPLPPSQARPAHPIPGRQEADPGHRVAPAGRREAREGRRRLRELRQAFLCPQLPGRDLDVSVESKAPCAVVEDLPRTAAGMAAQALDPRRRRREAGGRGSGRCRLNRQTDHFLVNLGHLKTSDFRAQGMGSPRMLYPSVPSCCSPRAALGGRAALPCPPRVSSVPAATSPPAGHRPVPGQPGRRCVDPGPGAGGLSHALRCSHPGLWAPWPRPGRESFRAHVAFGPPSLFPHLRGLSVLGAEGRQRGEELPTEYGRSSARVAGELCCPESRGQRLLIEAGRPGRALKGRAPVPRAPPEGSRPPAPARSSGSSGLKDVGFRDGGQAPPFSPASSAGRRQIPGLTGNETPASCSPSALRWSALPPSLRPLRGLGMLCLQRVWLRPGRVQFPSSRWSVPVPPQVPNRKSRKSRHRGTVWGPKGPPACSLLFIRSYKYKDPADIIPPACTHSQVHGLGNVRVSVRPETSTETEIRRVLSTSEGGPEPHPESAPVLTSVTVGHLCRLLTRVSPCLFALI